MMHFMLSFSPLLAGSILDIQNELLIQKEIEKLLDYDQKNIFNSYHSTTILVCNAVKINIQLLDVSSSFQTGQFKKYCCHF